MRLVTYQSENGPRVAAVREGGYVDLNRARAEVPSCIKALLAQGPEGMKKAALALEAGEVMGAETVRLVAPIPSPEKVICVGVNYADHARESGMEPPNEPVIFSKFASAVQTDGDPIVLPAQSDQVDYEAELVLVIGVGGRNIPAEQARDHIAGYCCGNDVSARDWQLHKPAGQWLLGKTFATFAPFGPALVTADEIDAPGNLRIESRVNGHSMQDSNTDQLIFSIEELIAYISGVCTLKPGDVIFTGTPPGVGMARKPPVFLKPGDTVEIEIEGLGVLRNPVVSEHA
ncbi:MAG: fumarylacetoacetate hydrolase family protein [Planctomycetes bacterium]|nr:fumarylacetoacetate hydrolase family protein [Planctomycetota bacterium]